MQKRIAKVDQEYAGRLVRVGQGFDVEPQDVVLLLTIGRIEPQDGDVLPGFMQRDMSCSGPQNYATRVMTANLRNSNSNSSSGKGSYKHKATTK